MSAVIEDSSPDTKGSVVTTNFDTYALILQLGCVLHTVPAWKKSLKLRVVVFVEYETDVEEENIRVRKLLDNLRIQAEVLVLWLTSGDLHSYDTIVNGTPTSNESWVESALGDERWWRELCNRRNNWERSGHPVQMRNVPPLVGGSAWPSSSFQQLGGAEVIPMKRRVKKILKKAARRHSFSGHAILNIPVSLNMGTQRLHSENVEDATSSDDSSEDDSIASSTASENGLAGYSDDERDSSSRRRASAGDALAAWSAGGLKRQTRETAGLQERASFDTDTIDPSAGPSSSKPSPSVGRTPLPSRPSFPNFSCAAIPDTRISRSDGAGPSITFADTGTEGRHSEHSASRHPIESVKGLSFNDLPSKGQHLILNELMKKHSHDTAVLFTTLPSPSQGTCKSEQDSLDYLSDLEVGFLERVAREYVLRGLLGLDFWSAACTTCPQQPCKRRHHCVVKGLGRYRLGCL
jgi:potassium/chloride transporter 9